MDGSEVWIANAFGVVAGLCSMASFVPQIVKIVRERDASAISLRMYAVTIVGFACWTTYGALLGEAPIVVTNSICLALSSFILVMTLLPRREKEAVADALDPEG